MDVETKQLIVGMAKDIGTLTSDVGSLKSDVGGLTLRMDSLQFSLDAFQEETDENFAIVKGRFDEVEIQLDESAYKTVRAESEDAAVISRQDRLEARIGILERKIR